MRVPRAVPPTRERRSSSTDDEARSGSQEALSIRSTRAPTLCMDGAAVSSLRPSPATDRRRRSGVLTQVNSATGNTYFSPYFRLLMPTACPLRARSKGTTGTTGGTNG